MVEQIGIQETKELEVAIIEVVAHVIKSLKDGFQAGADLEFLYNELWANPENKAKILAAVAGAGNVPAELKDLSVAEGLELAVTAAQEISEELK
jgi:hypothetical protein